MVGNCDSVAVWGKTDPQTVVSNAHHCDSEAAFTAVNFGHHCPTVATSQDLAELSAKCNGIAVDGAFPHTARIHGHSFAALLVDAAWIMITIALFIHQINTVFSKPTGRHTPAPMALAVSAIAVVAVALPVRDGTCFRAYADGTFEHTGDGASASPRRGGRSRCAALTP
jgi:hypothetical protein